MDIDQFWELIEPGRHEDEPSASLQSRLEPLAPEELESFQQHLDILFNQAYFWRLWGAANLICGGCSDDGFVDFRYALISKGREIYETALKDPDALVEVAIVPDELFGHIALDLYELKTGQPMARRRISCRCEPPGGQWDFDDLNENRRRLPRLSEQYGW